LFGYTSRKALTIDSKNKQESRGLVARVGSEHDERAYKKYANEELIRSKREHLPDARLAVVDWLAYNAVARGRLVVYTWRVHPAGQY
jgi:hypothetical protein